MILVRKKLCCVCKEREATQEHHICYDPEMKIDVCQECHQEIHNFRHGVGPPRGGIRKFSSRIIGQTKVSLYEKYCKVYEKVFEVMKRENISFSQIASIALKKYVDHHWS